MRKVLNFVLVVLVFATTLQITTLASESDFEIVNGTLVKYHGSGGNVIIPDGVKAIGNRAFYDCQSIKDISIPDSVTSIGFAAFEDCTYIDNVTIPSTVTEIAGWAFLGCSNLSNIIIPKTVISIGRQAFIDTAWLNMKTEEFIIAGDEVLIHYNGRGGNISIPYGVKTIADETFCYNQLTGAIIPDSVLYIGNKAFSGCHGLKEIIIPDSVISIGYDSFKYCNLKKVAIPKSVRYIGSEAFAATEWLDNQKDEFVIVGDNVLIKYNGSGGIVSIPSGVKCIGGCVFSKKSEITEMVVPDTVTHIGEYAFESCADLKKIRLPNSIEKIGYYAFTYCINLESINIPSSITSISEGMFQDCKNLESVKIPETVTEICDNAFSHDEKLKKIVIPNKVSFIGERAFENCAALEAVVIPESVTYIGDIAFADCENLITIKLPKSVGYIGENAFSGCTNLVKNEDTFADVKGTKYEEAVEVLAKIGIISGRDDGTFGINDYTTRAEAVKLICKLLNVPADEKSKTNFTDVSEEYWASGYINFAQVTGIVNGFDDGNFYPEDNLTFAQFVKMLVTALGYSKNGTLVYPYEYISSAKQLGITYGVICDNEQPLKRGDLAVIIYNSLDVDVITKYR